MKRLYVALALVMFVLVGCAGTAVSSLPTIPSGANPSTLASAGLDELCTESRPASLATIAGQLDNVAADTDTTAIESNLGTLLANLQAANVELSAQPAKTAAIAAVTQLQTSIKDPAARQAAAKQAATALKALETAICP